MVGLETPDTDDLLHLKKLIKRHFKLTESERAYQLLDTWNSEAGNFIKVLPTDYKKALERLANEERIKEKTN
jgi:glutamate synthase (ferredoxin)